MSVYRPKASDGSYKSEFWQYDFRLKPKGSTQSVRFHGSTSQKTKRAAERVELKIRERAAVGELNNLITVREACWRYWEEVAKFKPSADDQAKNLEHIQRLIGGDTLLVDVTAQVIATAAAHRAGEPIMVHRKEGWVPTKKSVSLSSVNRQVIEPLQRLMKRARSIWEVPVNLEKIDWSRLLYAESEERVREMTNDEANRFWAALRFDYHPICRFYLISGRRRSEVINLTTFDVDLGSMKARFGIRKKKSKDKVTKSLSLTQAQILREEMAKSPCEAVFTYLAHRGKDKGKRKPITAMGLKMQFNRALKAAGIVDFRLHDLRHTFASALLRASGGNFKLVQKALDHSDIKSTMRYAHVLDEDVVAGIEKLEQSRNYPGASLVPIAAVAEKK